MPCTPNQIAKVKDGPTKECIQTLNGDATASTGGLPGKGHFTFPDLVADPTMIGPKTVPVVFPNAAVNTPETMILSGGLAIAGVVSPSLYSRASKLPAVGLVAAGSLGGVGAVTFDLVATAPNAVNIVITANTLAGGETAEFDLVAIA